MIFTCNNKNYDIVLGSDVIDDGMYLEASELGGMSQQDRKVVLFAFWSDVDGNFTFSSYEEDLPFALVEAFVQMARERLPCHPSEQQ
jgi:hypothetical protein